jgi:N4-gp56 family major capsid protein
MADVITVTTGTAGTPGSTAAELVTYLSAQLLEVAELHTVLRDFGEKRPLPPHVGKTIRFVREEKLQVPQTPTQLTEGVPPDAVGITLNQIEATVEQYGNVVRLSDLAVLTARHPLVARTVYILGLQAAEVYDQLIYNTLSTTTNVYRPGGAADDDTLAASLAYADLVNLDSLLSVNGARPFTDGDYVLVIAPAQYSALQLDPDFIRAAQFKAPERIWKGEVAELAGFRIVRSNAPAFAAIGTNSSDRNVYGGFAIGRFAYQVTDLQNLRAYVVAPGGQADPLYQNYKIGWKFAFKAVITNTKWLINVRSLGANEANYDRNNP